MSMRLCAIVAAAGMFASVVNADIITQWNFNSPTNDADSATGTTAPAIGSGTASLVGGVTSPSFNGGGSTGTAPASSSDPNFTDNSGWQTTNYPASGTANRTAGVQFALSTSGYTGITIAFDVRHSNTSANTLRLQYTTDGVNFVNADQFTFTPAATGTGDSWYNRSADLSAIAGVNNNPNFAIRIVTEFDPGTGNYRAARSTSTYGTASTLRWDMVTVSGTVIPTPAAAALLGLGGLAAARRRRA